MLSIIKQLKKTQVWLDNFVYRVLLKNLLKTSHLGYGLIVEGAESGVNFEHIYNNQPKGSLLIGKYVDAALLNLSATEATRKRKDDIKQILWNEVSNNRILNRKTKFLDLASGGARYLRELVEEHNLGHAESLCIDKDARSIRLGQTLTRLEGIKNLRFFRGDIFRLTKLKRFSSKIHWDPNVVIASGLLIYFNDLIVEKMLREIYEYLPSEGLLVFTSYERLSTKKLMRKTMAVSSGEEWVLYYRKPEFWREILNKIGFKATFITQDKWKMNNVCWARK